MIDDERIKGFQDAVQGSNIKILEMQYAHWNSDEGFKVMQDYLAKYKKIDAVWANDDDMLLGVLRPSSSPAARTSSWLWAVMA